MFMFSGESSAYDLQLTLSDGRLFTIRGMGKDVPDDGDVITDLHSFSVEEGEKDPNCSFEETVGKKIRAIFVTVSDDVAPSRGMHFAFENIIEFLFDDGDESLSFRGQYPV